ncbi:beta-ketoacyl synthase N-terminal-like domain-containing protein [Actinomadura sp. LOL_016]|uniref:beta-ketoacyl synthase N-terminal-like domain-containing protein n=1 Tax=unclassified Actinomadura TaxID=2626254 RepID=UPI003A7F9995
MTVVISGMALMSPAGIGVDAFRDALRGGAALAAAAVEDFRTEPPAGTGRPVRLIDRPSAMAVATIADLLRPDVLAARPPHRRALVLGSGAAGIDQSMALTRDSLTRPRPDNVNPALVPACVMNYASGQAAIAFDLQGPNATVTAGRATGLAALQYARRLLVRDRADAVVCGAYEDVNPRRAAIAAAAGRASREAEGCCAFLVERAEAARAAGRPPLADVLAVESGVFGSSRDATRVLDGAVRRALRSAGAEPGDVGRLVPSADEAVPPSVPPSASPSPVRIVRPARVIGDTFGAMAAFQVAAAIVETDGSPEYDSRRDPRPDLALVTTLDPDGHAWCCLLRTHRRRRA